MIPRCPMFVAGLDASGNSDALDALANSDTLDALANFDALGASGNSDALGASGNFDDALDAPGEGDLVFAVSGASTLPSLPRRRSVCSLRGLAPLTAPLPPVPLVVLCCDNVALACAACVWLLSTGIKPGLTIWSTWFELTADADMALASSPTIGTIDDAVAMAEVSVHVSPSAACPWARSGERAPFPTPVPGTCLEPLCE